MLLIRALFRSASPALAHHTSAQQQGLAGSKQLLQAPLIRSLSSSWAVQMPTVGVNRDKLFEKLGRSYSECLPHLLLMMAPAARP